MTRTKKVTLILTTIILLFGLGFYLLTNYLDEKRHELNTIIQPMYTHITNNNWDRAVINKYASPQLQQWFDENADSALFIKLRSIGKIKHYQGVEEFEIKTSGGETKAKANVIMIFEGGPFLFETLVVKHNDKWYLAGFNSRKINK